MEFSMNFSRKREAQEFLINLNLEKYDILEFSFGGTNVVGYINFFFNDDGSPNDLILKILSPKNLMTKKIVCTSAGSIFIGLFLLNMYDNFKQSYQINELIKWFNKNKISNNVLYYFSLGTLQKEFLSQLCSTFPKKLLNLTIKEICEKNNLGYHPNFMYFDLKDIKYCTPETTIIDAINISSNIFDISDGGYFQFIKNQNPIYFNPKSIVFSVSRSYKSFYDNADIFHLIND